jgi:superfamily II DNA or RNA helicase
MIEAIRASVARGNRRVLAVLPTGGGKGLIAAKVMESASLKGNPSAFFASQRELVYQIGAQLGKLNLPARTIMAGVKDEFHSFEEMNGADCYIIAKDTLWARAFKSDKVVAPPARVVQVDEAHGSLAPTYQKILASYPDSVIIGWTATPCRSDGKPLGGVFDDMVLGASYRELQEQGFLVPVKVVAPDRPDLKGLKVSRGDYAKGALEKRMNRDEMVGNIVKEWMTHAEGRSTVLFAAGVDHSVHCRDMFRKEGITAEHLDGKMPTPERDDILGRVRDGKVMVLCNYGVAHTGTDVPRWKVMVCARPIKSFGLWRQMGGRIQRPYPGHDHCLIIDHSDNALHFGFPDEDVEWDLSGDEDQGKKHMEKKRKSEDGKPAKDPYACDKCKTMYRGYACPTCGHKPDRKSEAVKMTKGELKELERQKANKAATPMDKQKFWDECLGWSIGNKKKVGAAAHRYRERFGVFPNSSIQNVPRSSQWQMTGKQFYDSVVKPAKQAAQPEYQDSLPW